MTRTAMMHGRTKIWILASCILVFALVLGAVVFNRPPQGLALSTGAHADHPVLLHSLTINGTELNPTERFVAGGWADPKGTNHALLSMPVDDADRAGLTLTARWTDLTENVGYTGQIVTRMSDLTIVTTSRRTGEVIVLFGPDGYLELATSTDPDVVGWFNGRIIATACTQAGGGLPDTHWIWENGLYLDYQMASGGADTSGDTVCSHL